MSSKLSTFRYLSFLLALGMLPLMGCGDPTGTGDHASTVVFLQGDVEVARYVYPDRITGSGLSVGAGATATYSIRVLDDDGRQLRLDAQEFSIEALTVANPSIATAGLSAVDRVLVTGLLPGSTTLQFSLWHVGHEEFLVVGIPVTVGAP
jgi:Flp pilus assembly secretin CpaC